MKVAIFVENFGATGVVRNAIAIASRLSGLGHEAILVAAKPEGVLRASVPAGVTAEALNDSAGAVNRSRLMRRSFLRFRRFLAAGSGAG